jgi:hypothetical protein
MAESRNKKPTMERFAAVGYIRKKLHYEVRIFF